MEQINRVREKLKLLKKLDPGFLIFGSSRHKYVLNNPLPLDKVKKFENENSIRLPTEYVQFITEIGNGGAGPFYGLEPLENSLYQDLDYKNSDFLLSPSEPFMYTSPWNMKFESGVDEGDKEEEYQQRFDSFQEAYFDPKHMNGVIAICNFGCAVSLNLVVNGDEYGNIWTDDRSSDYGIHPSCELGNEGRITFLDWYEKWIDNSLTKLETDN